MGGFILGIEDHSIYLKAEENPKLFLGAKKPHHLLQSSGDLSPGIESLEPEETYVSDQKLKRLQTVSVTGKLCSWLKVKEKSGTKFPLRAC